jgi:hypothetical protein
LKALAILLLMLLTSTRRYRAVQIFGHADQQEISLRKYLNGLVHTPQKTFFEILLEFCTEAFHQKLFNSYSFQSY